MNYKFCFVVYVFVAFIETTKGDFRRFDYHEDESFAAAFDIALMDSIASGTVDLIMDKYGIPSEYRVRDCSSLATTWPTVSKKSLSDNRTTFSNIFSRGFINICALETHGGSRGNYVKGNVSGTCPEIEADVAKRIGAHYGYKGTLGVNYVWLNSTEDLFPALDIGKCDCTFSMMSVGGFSGGIRRAERWRHSCTVIGDVVALYVNDSLSVNSLQEFQNKFESPRIGSIDLAMLQFCPQLVIDSKSKSFLSDQEAYAALKKGEIDAFLGSTLAMSFPGIKNLTTSFFITRSAWFRKEITIDDKVKSLEELKDYMRGNEDLALTYEAALNVISQQTVTERIFNRFGIHRLETLNCYQSAGVYRVSSSTVGTLANVLKRQSVKIGYVKGDYGALSNGVTGALFDLEIRVAEWIGKLHVGADKAFVPDWVGYSSPEEMFHGLSSGEIDMTGSLYWQGGVDLITEEPLKRHFRPSCSAMSFYINFTVKNSSQWIDYHSILNSNKNLTISAIGFASYQFVHEFLKKSEPNVTVIKNNFIDGVIDDIQSGRADAGVLTYMSEHDIQKLGLRNIMTPYILPLCSFFRRDKIMSCGDGVVDTALGEECEETGIGCLNCKCVNYVASNPPGLNCVEKAGRNWPFILVSVIFVVIIISSIILCIVFCPKLRKKYIAMGANRMKNLLISERYSTTPAETEMSRYSNPSRIRPSKTVIVPSPIAPPRFDPYDEDDT